MKDYEELINLMAQRITENNINSFFEQKIPANFKLNLNELDKKAFFLWFQLLSRLAEQNIHAPHHLWFCCQKSYENNATHQPDRIEITFSNNDWKELHRGLKEMNEDQNDINFDDIDDCGRSNLNHFASLKSGFLPALEKTFVESSSFFIFLDIFENFYSVFFIKLVVFAAVMAYVNEFVLEGFCFD